MEAKDTVMSVTEILTMTKHILADNETAGELQISHRVAQAQAEITWGKAFRAGYDKALAQLCDMTAECEQNGRREVAEWVEKETFPYHAVPYDKESLVRNILEDKWQAKLKEWGID